MSEAEPITAQLDDCWNRIGVWAQDSSCPQLQTAVHCRNCRVYSAAGKQILERPPPAGYREEWTRIYAGEKQSLHSKTESVTVFRLGDELMALPSHLILEVTEIKTMRRIPNMGNPVIKGLVNNRGELYICVSLGRLLGLEKGVNPAVGAHTKLFDRMIVIAHEGHEFVFPVSEILGTCRFHPNELEAVPATLAKARAAYTKNMLPWRDHHVACLDHELLVYALNKSLQ